MRDKDCGENFSKNYSNFKSNADIYNKEIILNNHFFINSGNGHEKNKNKENDYKNIYLNKNFDFSKNLIKNKNILLNNNIIKSNLIKSTSKTNKNIKMNNYFNLNYNKVNSKIKNN